MSRGHVSGSGGGHFGGFKSGGFSGGSNRYSGSRTNINIGWWFPWFALSRQGGGSGENNSTEQSAVRYKKVRNKLATAIVSAVFIALCAMFIALSCVFTFDRKYAVVDGVVSSVENQGSDYEACWYTSYEFTLNGEEYSVQSRLGWTEIPDIPYSSNPNMYDRTEQEIERVYIGKTFKIYVNKDNPYEIYEVEGKDQISSTNAGFIVGAVFMGIIALLVLILGVNKRIIDTEYSMAMAEANAKKVPEGKRRCAYCGTLEDESATKCSNCGAPLK